MIIEALVVKGLVTAGHWVAAHGASGLAAKGGAIVAKSVATHGLAATASTVAGGAIATGFVVGGVVWTSELVKLVGKAVASLCDGDQTAALITLAVLFNKLHHVDIDYFPDVLESVLTKIGFSDCDADLVADFVRSREEDILRFSNLA